jgi:cell division protein ZapA
MGQVAVTIDGKSYRMACDDGQEDHLTQLAATFDSRVQDMRKSFGEIGDMRLAVMAAITLADEASELKRKLDAAAGDIAAANATIAGHAEAEVAREAAFAETVRQTADRADARAGVRSFLRPWEK